MISGIELKTTVKPGGHIELSSTELPVGKRVRVLVLIDESQIENNELDSDEFDNEDSPHPLAGLTYEERAAKIDAVAGSWKNDPELTEIFAEIDRERHADTGRPPVEFDN